MIHFRLNKFHKIAFGVIFTCLLFQELIESYKWGVENALNIDVLIFSTLSIISILINNYFNKLIITIVLSYFIWMLICRHFPAYPEYQSFTFLCNNFGLRSLELQKFFHLFLYVVLLLTSYLFNHRVSISKK